MKYYISHDNYGKLALIVDRDAKRVLLYDQLGVAEYEITRFRLADYAPCVPVTAEEFWNNLYAIDDKFAESKHRDILPVPLPEFTPESRWEFVDAREYPDGSVCLISCHRYADETDYAIVKIAPNGHWHWHRLDYVPEFKDDIECKPISKEATFRYISCAIENLIENNHFKIRKFIHRLDGDGE